MPFRTLYAKLAAALLALLCVVGILYVTLTLFTTQRYIQEVTQRLHLELAGHLVAEQLLISEGRIDREALENVFHTLMVVNPQIEVYLLDPDGRILAYSAPPGRVRRERVSLPPIRTFLAGTPPLPLLGDDPRDPSGRKVFSAAAIPQPTPGAGARHEGYLYVVLEGEEHDSVATMLQGSYILRLSMWTAGGGLFLVLLAGLGLFRALTRRLRLLAGSLDRFRAGSFADPVELPAGVRVGDGDEIDRLAESYSRMAERIDEQVCQLQQTDRLRRELVANVSHDLRTPLAALQGYLETLLLKELPAVEQRRYLQVAARQSERLGRLVAQLFELAKLDSDEVRLHPEPFSLSELAQDVVHELQLEAEDKGIRLEARLAPEQSLVVGDIQLIERLFSNLIDNALRYTSLGGTVRVAVGVESGRVRADVSDTGRGIPGEELEHIFERFYRLHPPEAGAGLGLAIAKKIVELHRGTIEVRSTRDVGTTFTFRLPVAAATA